MIDMKDRDGNGIINISIRNDHSEALLQWSENLAVLGRTLRWLNEHEDPECALLSVAPQLGFIIEDYANMINQVCNQACGAINEFFMDGKHTLVSRAKETYTRLRKSSWSCPADINIIDKMVGEMKPALTDAMILKELLCEFEKIKKTMEQELDAKHPERKADRASTAAAAMG